MNTVILLKSLADISRTCCGSISHYQFSFTNLCQMSVYSSFFLDSEPRLVWLKYRIAQRIHVNFSVVKKNNGVNKKNRFFRIKWSIPTPKKKIKLKTIDGGKQGKILLLKNNKNGNHKAGGFPLMPHDMPSLRCTLSCWYERPRWREQKPWTVREPRRKPGRRTIQIRQTHF